MRIEELPLAEALLFYLQRGKRPYHTPGHKQGAGLPRELLELWGREVFRYDLTELPGLDDLHAPRGAIGRAQEAAARCFGAEESWFLVNGSTVGIQASIMAAVGQGELVLVPRQMHRSVLGGLILSGARPVYLPVEAAGCRIPLTTRKELLEAALAGTAGLRAVVAVHPNYYGICGDLSHLVELCHCRGIPVLVDEAHGPHFGFDCRLPRSAMASGADVAVQGWHKLLTSLTQTAVLHCQGTEVDRERLRRCLALLQTTSPSYLFLLSLDVARWQMENRGREIWSRVLDLAERLRRRINSIPGLYCLGEEIQEHPAVGGWDPSKLVVDVSGLGLTGPQAASYLSDSGVAVEMADPQNVLLLLTPGDSAESVEFLEQALHRLAREYPPVKGKKVVGGSWEEMYQLQPRVVLTPAEAVYQKGRRVKLEEAAGEISCEFLCPYPPGVTLLAPGEEITREILETVCRFKQLGFNWQGPSDPLLNTLLVL